MRTIIILALILVVSPSGNLVAQSTVTAQPGKWLAYNCKADFYGDTIHLVNTSGKSAVLWVRSINFKNGTIELDIKGQDVRGESFVGVAFHAFDNETYDAIYFRPFNFRDPERKDHAVQYIDKPSGDWDILRTEHPGKYEHFIVPDADPNSWFHVKMEVRYPYIAVYVNGSTEPTLSVMQISKRKNGLLGLWTDSKDGWFKNLTIAAEKE